MDFLGSILTGGATGLIGTLFSGVFGFFKARGDRKHEIAMRKIDLEEFKLEAESAERLQSLKLEGQVARADSEALQASYRLAQSRWTSNVSLSSLQVWLLLLIDVVRGLMRPVLTCAFVYGSFYILQEEYIEPHDVVSTILYLTVASVTWWFGNRTIEKLSTTDTKVNK